VVKINIEEEGRERERDVKEIEDAKEN